MPSPATVQGFRTVLGFPSLSEQSFFMLCPRNVGAGLLFMLLLLLCALASRTETASLQVKNTLKKKKRKEREISESCSKSCYSCFLRVSMKTRPASVGEYFITEGVLCSQKQRRVVTYGISSTPTILPKSANLDSIRLCLLETLCICASSTTSF